MAKVLNQNDNVKNDDGLSVYYNDKLEPDPDGRMMMKITREEKDGFAHCSITITYDGETVYELETGRVQRGGEQ